MRSKHLHVHCTCTIHPSPLLHTAPVGLAKVHPCTEFGVASSKVYFHRRTPRQKSFAPGACSWHPTETATLMDFKLVQYACDLRLWGQWCFLWRLWGEDVLTWGPPVKENFELATPNSEHRCTLARPTWRRMKKVQCTCKCFKRIIFSRP